MQRVNIQTIKNILFPYVPGPPLPHLLPTQVVRAVDVAFFPVAVVHFLEGEGALFPVQFFLGDGLAVDVLVDGSFSSNEGDG